MSPQTSSERWFITGCSSGFGEALAVAALRRGHRVVATARRPRTLDALVERWGEQVLPIELDVLDGAQIQAAVDRASSAWGGIDVLVNNAGRVQFGAVEEMTDAELRALFELNVLAPAALVRAVLPQMRARRRGTIVQMSSMGSFFISTGFSAYSATKAALEGLSATLALEVEPFGIRVVILQPGGHRTGVFSAGQIGFSRPMPEYADIVGPTREFVTGLDGAQDGDPARASEIVVDVVGDPSPPLRVPLGADAFETITEAVAAIDRNVRDWEAVARSTAFGAADVARPSDPAARTR